MLKQLSLMGNCMRKGGKGGREVTLAILGLDNAGKTVTTKGLQGEPFDSVAPTVGFSSVEFRFEKCDITMFDLGGGKRIRDIWKNYFSEVYGVIYVIDSSEPERLDECASVLKSLIEHPKVSGKPILVLANKQDVKGALDEVDICEGLRLEEMVNMHRCPCRLELCSAVLGQGKKLDKSIRAGMSWLIATIFADWENTKVRIEADIEEQRENERKEKAERAERVRKIREERAAQEKAERQARGENSDEGDNDEPDGDPFKQLNLEELKKKEAKLKEEKRKKKEKQRHSSSEGDSPASRRQKVVDSEDEERVQSQRTISSRFHTDTRASAKSLPPLRAAHLDDPNLSKNNMSVSHSYDHGASNSPSPLRDSEDEDERPPKSQWIKPKKLGTPRPEDLTPPGSDKENEILGTTHMKRGGVLAPIGHVGHLEPLDGLEKKRKKKKKKAKKNQTLPAAFEEDEGGEDLTRKWGLLNDDIGDLQPVTESSSYRSGSKYRGPNMDNDEIVT